MCRLRFSMTETSPYRFATSVNVTSAMPASLELKVNEGRARVRPEEHERRADDRAGRGLYRERRAREALVEIARHREEQRNQGEGREEVEAGEAAVREREVEIKQHELFHRDDHRVEVAHAERDPGEEQA